MLVPGGQGFLGESDYVGTDRDGDRGMVEVDERLEFGSEMGQAAPLSRRPATVLLAQLPTDADRWRLSQNLASGRLDGQEPSRAFVAAFIDRMLGRITREEFLAGNHHLPPCTRTDYQPSHHPTPATPPTPPPLP